MKIRLYAVLPIVLIAGCTPTIKTQNELTIKPVQITVDINLKVDQALTEALENNRQAPVANDERGLRRERMRTRRPALTAAKREQLIGENNQGILEPRAEISGDLRIVLTAENTDRAAMFAEIARRENSTPELVGARFADRVADRAPAGTLLQDNRGNWNAKP